MTSGVRVDQTIVQGYSGGNVAELNVVLTEMRLGESRPGYP